jgi:hypothetical protein
MFSGLVEYTDRDFAIENPYFFIHTPDGTLRTYRVFMAAVIDERSPIYRLGAGMSISFGSDAEFVEYLEMVRRMSIFSVDDLELDEDSQIVILSTCTNLRLSDRFVVTGVLIDEREH